MGFLGQIFLFASNPVKLIRTGSSGVGAWPGFGGGPGRGGCLVWCLVFLYDFGGVAPARAVAGSVLAREGSVAGLGSAILNVTKLSLSGWYVKHLFE